MAVLWKNTGYVLLAQQGALVSPLTAVVYQTENPTEEVGLGLASSKLGFSTAPGDGVPPPLPLWHQKTTAR